MGKGREWRLIFHFLLPVVQDIQWQLVLHLIQMMSIAETLPLHQTFLSQINPWHCSSDELKASNILHTLLCTCIIHNYSFLCWLGTLKKKKSKDSFKKFYSLVKLLVCSPIEQELKQSYWASELNIKDNYSYPTRWVANSLLKIQNNGLSSWHTA